MSGDYEESADLPSILPQLDAEKLEQLRNVFGPDGTELLIDLLQDVAKGVQSQSHMQNQILRKRIKRMGSFFGGAVIVFIAAGLVVWRNWPSEKTNTSAPAPATVAVSQSTASQTKAAQTMKKITFDELVTDQTVLAEIEPTGDGAAYLRLQKQSYSYGHDSGLWYLRGAEALKVQEVSQFSERNKPSTTSSWNPILNNKIQDLRGEITELRDEIDHLNLSN